MNGWLKEQQILNSEQEETIVMFHGFIGSPFDFKPLVDVLEKQNYRLVLPFLPAPMGNGENTLNAARAVIDRYKPSILIGFSMGGALSILLSDTVSKVILLAPYLGLPTGNQIATKGASLVHKMIPRIPKLSSGRIASKEGRVRYEPRGYSFETHSFIALQKLAGQAQLKVLEVPCLWAHAPKDPVASYKKAQKKLMSHSEHLLLPDAHHVLLYDNGHVELIERIQSFL